MEKKTLKQVPIHVRDTYNRALQSANEPERAIKLLLEIIREFPELFMAREKLREMERAKLRKQGGAAKGLALLLSIVPFIIIKIMTAVNPVKAMAMCESCLARCLDNPLILGALAAAADQYDAAFIAADALGIVYEFHPNNEPNARKLVAAYQQCGMAREALKVLQPLAKKSPGNLSTQAELREALALASIERGNWESEGSTQDKASDSKAQVTQQLIDGTIHDAEQARVLIEKFTADLKVADSMDIRRKLAEAYYIAEEYEEAINQLKAVAKAVGAFDPVLDKQIERAYIAQLNQAIKELRSNPEAYENAEGQIEQLEQEKIDYRLRHAEERVRVFPNDASMQMDMGQLYFETGAYDRAETHFREAASGHLKEVPGKLYLGRCCFETGRYEEAIKWFEEVVSKIPSPLDRTRLEAQYRIGLVYEATGENDRALDIYQAILQQRGKFEDVPQRVDRLSGVGKEASEG